MSAPHALECARLVRPASGHHAAGDAAVIVPGERLTFLAIVDVLGHGLEASPLAIEIAGYLREHADADVAGLMGRLDAHLAGSRGAAAGLAAVEPATGRVRYCGIGNTVLRRVGTRDARLVSRDGVLGAAAGRPREETLVLEPGDLLLLYTDGIRSHFETAQYPQILSDTPRTVVETLVERFGKDHDDASCIAVRRR